MAAFTIQFELGPETRAIVERAIAKASIELELGAETRDVIRDLADAVRDRRDREAAPGGEAA